MRIHHLQHVHFEGLGSMEPYFKADGHVMSSTHFYKNDPLPHIDDFDVLIIMGGPMGVHDEEKFPYLKEEKSLIKKAIDSGKAVLGICLGAQLMADVLGAGVTKNKHREIGWFPLRLSDEFKKTPMGSSFPDNLNVFHWHGDRFDIPEGAIPIGASEACDHQGFIIGDRIAGFQFHLETTLTSAQALVDHCGHEIDGSAFVQTGSEMISDPYRFLEINQVMHFVLDYLVIGASKQYF